MPSSLTNPILRGFSPDPSICRVGDDFYVATSTFEWYPGVQIYHSRDLRHWRLLHRPLSSERLLNLEGRPDSCGVWAPCLTHSDDQFWLCYTDVRRFDGRFKDTHNYLITAPDIGGPWSDPIYLNSSGFDPSLFHDADGRKWVLNMVWDHRPDQDFFGGIVLQEYEPQAQRLRGERHSIFAGTELGLTEGPHLYRIGDEYHLITAEGGTGFDHAVTVARAPQLTGPYTPDPAGPLVTARDRPDWPLQRAGHGDMVQLKDGSYWLAYLATRRFDWSRHSPLGRETAIDPLVLNEAGWFELASGDRLPSLNPPAPDLPTQEFPAPPARDDFDQPELAQVYQWLRTPDPQSFYSLQDRPGYLRLYGAESPGSLYRQALIARRQTHESFVAETELEFAPENFQQLAGLLLYYNASKFHYLYVGFDQALGPHVGVMSCEADPSLALKFPAYDERAAIPSGEPLGLRFEVDGPTARCFWRAGGEGAAPAWQSLPCALDMRLLTDHAGMTWGEQFTGTFIGLAAHDVSGQRAVADFAYFSVTPR
ncbi:MAG: glycoside hydrolase family 43 protein [Pseudomonadota bacterium]